MSAGETYPGTQAVWRAISLLKAFTDEQPELSLVELARLLGLNKTTAYRLLTALENEGLVARNADTETYRLGPEMIVLGGRALRANELRPLSRGELQALAHEIGEAATLELLVGDEVLVLEEIPGGHLVSTNQAVGTRWPAYTTSTGKAMLADLPDSALAQALPGPLVQLTGWTITNLADLRAELAQVRRQGFAVADQEIEIGFIAVGAAVRNHEGRAVAAISVNGPTARLTPARIPEVGALVKAAAERISDKLGFRIIEQRGSGAEEQG